MKTKTNNLLSANEGKIVWECHLFERDCSSAEGLRHAWHVMDVSITRILGDYVWFDVDIQEGRVNSSVDITGHDGAREVIDLIDSCEGALYRVFSEEWENSEAPEIDRKARNFYYRRSKAFARRMAVLALK